MTYWREDPRLKGKFHPDYPDDIQVTIHDGGPYMTKHCPEIAWVRVTGLQEDVFIGTLLNQPEQLCSTKEGSTIKFIVPASGKHPLMVTDKYLSERDKWTIHPCSKCGFSEIFDAPSDLSRATLPPPISPEEVLVSFTTRCGACGTGCQVIEMKDIPPEWGSPPPEGRASLLPERAPKKWWQFWK